MNIQVNDFRWEPGKNDAEYIKLLESSRDEWQRLAQKAIAKLKALSKAHEPRVLTLDEVRQDGKACFIETRHNNHLHPAFFNDFFRNDETTVFLMTIGDLPFRNDGYGKGWRCWSAKPTEEQQRKVKWDE